MENVVNNPGFSEAVVHLSGFLFVLIVLAVLWLIVGGIGIRFSKMENDRNKDAAAQSARSAAPALQEDELSEDELVVLSAAVAIMLGDQGRMVSIRKTGVDWSREGRRQHVQSHTFRGGF